MRGGICWSYLSCMPSLPFFFLLLLVTMKVVDSFLWEVHPIGPFHAILTGLSVAEPDPQALTADPTLASERTLPLATKSWSKEWGT